MRQTHLLVTLVVLLNIVACGGSSTTPTAPSSTPSPSTPASTATFTLTGLVIDDAAQVVVGATVTVLDGPNANRSALTDGTGRYSLTGLSTGGFSVRVRRDGYDDATKPVTLTSSTSVDFTIPRLRISLSGSMTGTYSFTNRASRQRVTTNMVATVVQAGQTISGTFRITTTGNTADEWTGSFTGTLSSLTPPAQYAGNLTVSGLISTGSGRCNGTRSNVTGTVSQTQLVLSAPGVWNWNECSSSVEDTIITLNK